MTKKNLKSEKIKKSTKIFEQGDIYSSSQKKYWEDLFYNTLQENLNEQIENKQKINKSLQLVEILSEFNKFCQNIFENIVNDFNKLETERKFKPCLVKSDTLIYDLKDERIVIKLTGYGSKKRDDFLSNYKALGNEFRAYKFVLNRLMQNMKKNSKKIIFKVPLCCLIDYLGFRCLAYCKSNEIDGDKTLVLGFDSKNIYQRNNLLNENIIFSLADIFNIRVFFNYLQKSKNKI